MKLHIICAAMTVVNVAVAETLLARIADSWIRNNQETQGASWYGRAVIYKGYEAAYELAENETLLDWYRAQIDDKVIAPGGSIINFDTSKYSLDDYRIGLNLLYWHQKTGEEKYRTGADFIRDRLNQHPRTPTGGFWHRSPTYPNQMWLDGIFMADSFYAAWTSLFDADNTTAWDDIVLQWDKIQEATIEKETGLPLHGFDESKVASWAGPETGASPIVWSRAVGWYAWSLIEVLDVFPKSHEGYKRLRGYYDQLAAALLKAQDPESHGWWLVLNKKYAGVEGNYLESSAAAMFTYGWLAGLRRGYLDEDTFAQPAANAYRHLVNDFVVENADGTITWTGTVEVGSLNSDASFEYYTGIPIVTDDTRGVGSFMMTLYEWERRTKA